jgi:putative aldouronate transport system permease protein
MIYDFIRLTILVLFTLICVLPFIHVLGVSLMPQREALSTTAILWPKTIDFSSYSTNFKSRNIILGIFNSIYITVFGTITALIATSTFAYGLSKQKMPGCRLLNGTMVFTMMFTGGLIPLYLNCKAVGLMDTRWSVICTLAINPFWCILMRNFYEQLPVELFECAEMEGAKEFAVFSKIALPLSKAAMAAFTLFYAVRY